MILLLLLMAQVITVWSIIWMGQKNELPPEVVAIWTLAAACFPIITIGAFMIQQHLMNRNQGQNTPKNQKRSGGKTKAA